MHRIKYLIIVFVVAASSGYILWRQGNKMWTEVTTEVVSGRVEFVSQLTSSNVKKEIQSLEKSLRQNFLSESKYRQLGQMHLGMSESFLASDFYGIFSLKKTNQKHGLEWLALKNDSLKLWSKDFIKKTWEKSLAEFQRNQAPSFLYIEHPSGEAYWSYTTTIRYRSIRSEQRVVVSVLPVKFLQSSVLVESKDGLYPYIINANWRTVASLSSDYVSRKMSSHPLASQINLKRGFNGNSRTYKQNGSSFLGTISPIAGTNLYTFSFAPLKLNESFIKNMLASTLTAMLYVLLTASFLLLVLPERLDKKYRELLASLRLLAENKWSITEAQAQLIPEALESLQSLNARLNFEKNQQSDRSVLEDRISEHLQRNKELQASENVNLEKTTEVEIQSQMEVHPEINLEGEMIDNSFNEFGGTRMANLSDIEKLNQEPPEPSIPQVNLKENLEELLSAVHANFDNVKVETDIDSLSEETINESSLNGFKMAIKPVVKNAFEASQSRDNPLVKIEGRELDGNYRIRISDNGEGMQSEFVEKIFDPFVTTKSSSTHPGLGLTAARNQIQKVDGQILVNSTEGVGTVVDIVWPVTKQTVKTFEAPVLKENFNDTDEEEPFMSEASRLISNETQSVVIDSGDDSEVGFRFEIGDDMDEFSSSSLVDIKGSKSDVVSGNARLTFSRSDVDVDDDSELPDMLVATNFSGLNNQSGISLSERSELPLHNDVSGDTNGEESWRDPRMKMSELEDFKVSIRPPKLSE